MTAEQVFGAYKSWWRWIVLALALVALLAGASILTVDEPVTISLFVVALVFIAFGGLGFWGALRMGVRATALGIEERPVVGPMQRVLWSDIVGFTIADGPSILPSKAPTLMLAEGHGECTLSSLAYYGWWGNTPQAVSRLEALVNGMIEKRGDGRPAE